MDRFALNASLQGNTRPAVSNKTQICVSISNESSESVIKHNNVHQTVVYECHLQLFVFTELQHKQQESNEWLWTDF